MEQNHRHQMEEYQYIIVYFAEDETASGSSYLVGKLPTRIASFVSLFWPIM